MSPIEDPKINGSTPPEKADKEKLKRREKKDRRERERRDGEASTLEAPASNSTPTPSEPSASLADGRQEAEESKSPAESTGTRTPKSSRPPRHPWTIFMRMSNHITVNEYEIKEFFGEAKGGVSNRALFIPSSH
jgi:hypothetical protein